MEIAALTVLGLVAALSAAFLSRRELRRIPVRSDRRH